MNGIPTSIKKLIPCSIESNIVYYIIIYYTWCSYTYSYACIHAYVHSDSMILRIHR